MNKPVWLAGALLLVWLTPQAASADAVSHRAAVERLFTLHLLKPLIRVIVLRWGLRWRGG